MFPSTLIPKPLSSDTVVTTLLAEWPLTGDFFDGDCLNGPVPRLFALDPDAARAAISSDPSKAFKDLQRIHARIPISEHVTPEEAWEYVGNPRYLHKQYQNNLPLSTKSFNLLHTQHRFCIQTTDLHVSVQARGLPRPVDPPPSLDRGRPGRGEHRRPAPSEAAACSPATWSLSLPHPGYDTFNPKLKSNKFFPEEQ